jgi:hypothetical protein
MMLMKVVPRVVVLVLMVALCGMNVFVSRGSIQQQSPLPMVSLHSIINNTTTNHSDDVEYQRGDNEQEGRKSTNTSYAASAQYQQQQQQSRQPMIGAGENRRRVYWRYDEAGRFDTVTVARSHWLPSIPSTRQIPIEHAENVTYHLQQRTNLTNTPSLRNTPNSKGQYRTVDPAYNITHDFRTLYLYNPSVVAIPYDDDILGIRASFGDDRTIAYVATFRLYLGGNCFGPSKDRTLMKAGEQINYLGVALLDASLRILYDAVVDVNAGPLPNNGDETMHYWHAFKQPAEDCRMFHVGRPSLALICNALHFQIQLRNMTAAPTSPSAAGKDATAPTFPHVYPNLYGDTLQVVLVELPTLLIRGKEAKNMNVFHHQGTHYLQVYPHPHWYRPLFDTTANAVMVPDSGTLLSPSFDTPDVHHTIRASTKDLRRGKNRTVDEQPFFAVGQQDDQDRGTACCVTVQYQGRAVRVGISHVKLHRAKSYWTQDRLKRYENVTYTYGWNRYLSRFLAYELDPPFAVVGVSGWFCLGFGGTTTDADDDADGNPLAGRNTQYRLDLFEQSYDCPAIHFASGIAETVDDSTKAIISYGVNDCYPRIMIVDKKDIEHKLDPSLYDNSMDAANR